MISTAHVLAHVPTSIIRRHGRVRFTVAISTGDRMILSYFLPELNRTLPTSRSSSPSLPIPCSFLPRAASTRCPRNPISGCAAASGWRVERITLAALTSGWSGQNEVVMETHGPGYTLGYTLGNMADLTLLSFCLALDKGVDHLARGFRKDYPRWVSGKEPATRRETPWASGSVYCERIHSTLRVPLILYHNAKCVCCTRDACRCATYAHRRAAIPDT